MEPEKFVIDLPDIALNNLRSRLQSTNWPNVIGDDDWKYGVPQSWLQHMAEYWATKWDWQSAAAEINQWQHYRVEIDEIPIHYMHAPASTPDAPAIVLTHGWPWTFWDYRYLIGPLSNPEAHGFPGEQAFNVYVPSLPGFGFSTPLTKAEVNVPKVAELWVKLMTEILGYEKFCAHGGDWGALVTAHLAHAHADKIIGAHLALALIPGVDRSRLGPESFAENEQWMVKRAAESQQHITSHITTHRLDPQTLGYALTDSPIGTAAWIWERRRNWSDCDGDVEQAFGRDHLCTTAALYWCTGAINSSMRLYHEHFKADWPLAHNRMPVLEAPTGFAVFPKDVVHMP
ncbi:MAG: alpha/beta fold hydrolase, partial [Gammaproteobacteria bacterium]|nr:alpha/beta fold hydrolase [Gammaproteobacteria bacterium]